MQQCCTLSVRCLIASQACASGAQAGNKALHAVLFATNSALNFVANYFFLSAVDVSQGNIELTTYVLTFTETRNDTSSGKGKGKVFLEGLQWPSSKTARVDVCTRAKTLTFLKILSLCFLVCVCVCVCVCVSVCVCAVTCRPTTHQCRFICTLVSTFKSHTTTLCVYVQQFRHTSHGVRAYTCSNLYTTTLCAYACTCRSVT